MQGDSKKLTVDGNLEAAIRIEVYKFRVQNVRIEITISDDAQ